MNTTHRTYATTLAAIAALVVAFPLAAKLKVHGEHSVSVHCSGPAGLAFDAKGKDLRVNDSGATLEVVVGVNDFDSGISLRDKHMKEKYLDAPEISDRHAARRAFKTHFSAGWKKDRGRSRWQIDATRGYSRRPV